MVGGPLDFLKSAVSNTNAATVAGTALSQDQVVNGLKEALGKGVERAVASLGRTNGFLTNMNVKIPMPAKLQSVEKGLRAAGQGKLVDDFVTSMNRAAEQAVPTAAAVFGDSIKQMSIADAKGILGGTNDAATQFFRRTTQTNLHAKFFPLVQKATDSVGVTASYKQMMSKFTTAGSLGGLFGGKSSVKLDAADIDSYVTDRAMDGLFKVVADEEKSIRANPVARTSDLLQKVFGSGK
ncbi:MAG: DUF4197 domain-containing protein [Verrucomicrobia bacterium]|nr:DUF4197 domain-containing protein [Verrucomicrobiota bacterium]